jgi:hypothetical protein
MKRLSQTLLLMAVIIVALSGCVRIEQGYVGLKAWELGDSKGEIEVFGVGRWARNGVKASWTKYPTFKQNYVWTADSTEGSKNDESFTFPIEGLIIGIDVGIEFSADADRVVEIFSEYRKKLGEITDGPMRNYVRDAILDAAKSYSNMEQFITENEISGLMDAVQESVTAYFKPKGLAVSQVYLINAPRYPASVTSSIEAKIKATQQAIQRENELRETEAAAKKKVAEAEGQAAARVASANAEAKAMIAIAQAEAEANALKQKSYTPAVLQAMWLDRWNGVLPEYMTESALKMIMTK